MEGFFYCLYSLDSDFLALAIIKAPITPIPAFIISILIFSSVIKIVEPKISPINKISINRVLFSFFFIKITTLTPIGLKYLE